MLNDRFKPNVASSESLGVPCVKDEIGALLATGTEPFTGFSQGFSERHPTVANLLTDELAWTQASCRPHIEGNSIALADVRAHMEALTQCRTNLRTLAIKAGVAGDEAGATIISATDHIIASAHASGGRVTRNDAATTLQYESQLREEAEQKLVLLGRLANGQSILTTEDKMFVGMIFAVGGAGVVIGAGASLLAGEVNASAMFVLGLGCLTLWMGKIALKQAQEFALTRLR